MAEEKVVVIGDFIEPKATEDFDLSSTLRLRARSINLEKLWASKDRSAEFMGDIWSLFVDSEKEERIKTVLHSVCVELIENSVKYGRQEYDYLIVVDLCLKNDELLVYVVNKSDPCLLSELETAARLILDTKDNRKLFKQKMKEAKTAKKQGKKRSQLGFVRIMMQDVRLAWQIRMESEVAVVTTLARISLTKKDA
ncbi:hypothetical protein DENIS_0435 [Desulfonema ishimotonii]|uniref:ATP-binding protein n=1 Tax=Desulfonema ishimotonii TaxID=45657 RepID=A0A401FRA4_9BACT|nr:hypothetical protein [Desulfonema ishimotonii]GBC59496.1 hypothetical protein DENIS_0435 [Desulfonema ishimotonii]